MGSLLECGGVEGLAPDVGRVQTGLGEWSSVWALTGAEGGFVLWSLETHPHPPSPHWGEIADTFRLRLALSAPSSGTVGVEDAFLGVAWHLTNLSQLHHAWGAFSELQEGERQELFKTYQLTPHPQNLWYIGLGWHLGVSTF